MRASALCTPEDTRPKEQEFTRLPSVPFGRLSDGQPGKYTESSIVDSRAPLGRLRCGAASPWNHWLLSRSGGFRRTWGSTAASVAAGWSSTFRLGTTDTVFRGSPTATTTAAVTGECSSCASRLPDDIGSGQGARDWDHDPAAARGNHLSPGIPDRWDPGLSRGRTSSGSDAWTRCRQRQPAGNSPGAASADRPSRVATRQAAPHSSTPTQGRLGFA